MKKTIFLIILSYVMPLSLMAEQPTSPEFIRGYAQSKLEDRFYNANIQVDVINQDIIVYNWPANLDCLEIQNCLAFYCSNYNVHFNNAHVVSNKVSLDTVDLDSPIVELAVAQQADSSFLPEHNRFFPTMLAQPHIIGYSAGYRSYDKIFKATLPVSIGDQFSLFKFKINSCSSVYFGIEACVWAVFEAKPKSLSLINADYFIGLPLTYINRNFSARLRIFHQSSHLGDEFLLENQIVRKNPSMEGVDISIAYEPIDKLVYFLGYTRIIRSDDSFKVKPNSIYYGFNYFMDFAKIQTFSGEAIPYVAGYFINNENTHWDFDSSVAIGYQWEKYYGHKLRIYVQGHHGYSPDGQFARKKSKYISVNLLYSY
ncbi:MAG TPA: DUF1207 domain-containing protein [Parachlamydiaceae bacterium]|nr:DUF1207 domain-containing protein [Nitrosopumilus sp.]HEV8052123.1 DUF1207 domain-containing protein [Parachlamydiaceae bacterium]